LDGFQIKSKSNPNQYTPPGFGKSTKSNTLQTTLKKIQENMIILLKVSLDKSLFWA
jgi:hypothetical protein